MTLWMPYLWTHVTIVLRILASLLSIANKCASVRMSGSLSFERDVLITSLSFSGPVWNWSNLWRVDFLIWQHWDNAVSRDITSTSLSWNLKKKVHVIIRVIKTKVYIIYSQQEYCRILYIVLQTLYRWIERVILTSNPVWVNTFSHSFSKIALFVTGRVDSVTRIFIIAQCCFL